MSNVFDIEADADGNPRPAPPEPKPANEAPRPPPPRRRPRRPSVAGAAPASKPDVVRPGEFEPEAEGSTSLEQAVNGEDLPKDPSSLWTRMQEWYSRNGKNIDDVRIKVQLLERNGAPVASGTYLQPELSGTQVLGDPQLNQTPGEHLMSILVDVHHQRQPPSVYVVQFASRRTGKTLKQSNRFALEAWVDIQRKREEVAGRNNPFGSGSYQAVPRVAASSPAAAPAALDPFTQYLMDQVNEMRRERGQQPVVPPPTTPTVADPMDAMMRDMERWKKLQALFAPAPQQNLEQTVTQIIIRLQEAGVIPKAGAAPVAGAPTSGAVPGSLEWVLELKAQEEKLKDRLKRLYPEEFRSKEEVEAAKNVEDAPPTAQVIPGSQFMGEPLKWIAFPDEEAPGGWKAWLFRMAAENPRRSGEFIERTMKAIGGNEGLLSKLMDAVKQAGGAEGIDAARTVESPATAAGTGGWNPQT